MESRARGTGSVAAMILGVLAVYAPLALLDGRHTLIGIDYTQFHARRIHYAQEALRGGGGLPAWFSRELFGTPFWSNVQSFPFLPTRLALLPIEASLLYPVAVNLDDGKGKPPATRSKKKAA